MVALARYTAVDDYGTMINPFLVSETRVHGAIAQGAGQALFEHAAYDSESGQLIAGSFMDYCMPHADDLPSFDLSFQGIPCTTNPLGVKGSGEAGAIAEISSRRQRRARRASALQRRGSARRTGHAGNRVAPHT